MHYSIKPAPNFLIVGILIILLSFSCNTNLEKPLFKLRSASETGIDFTNKLVENDSFNIIQYLYFYNGGGVAIGDINNDDLPDIYFTSNQESNRLYLNKGKLQFEDISKTAGVAGKGNWSTGVTTVDINADGWLDIYVCQVGNYKNFHGKNQLFINQKDGTFKEQATEYGLDHEGFSTQAAFLDYDIDGDLDMYLLCHSVHSTVGFRDANLRKIPNAAAGDKLYRNEDGKFVNVTKEAGIFSGINGYGLGIAIGDIDQNGCPDIYVGNDFHENDFLYLNNCDGTFSEKSTETFGHTSKFSMGNDLADFNNDALLDVLTMDMKPANEVIYRNSAGNDAFDIYQYKLGFGYSHQLPRNMLQLNKGGDFPLAKGIEGVKFSDIAQLSNIAATDWSWSALMVDFDNDGWKDIHITNGIIRRPNDLDYIKFSSNQQIQAAASDLELAAKMPIGKVSNFIFKNNTDLTFSDETKNWGIARPSWSNGAAYADLDNDGDLDLVINNINEPAFIYENQSRQISKNNYLKIQLKGSPQNPFGIGAKVTLHHSGQLQYQELYPTRGWQSSVDYGLHFGVGETNEIDYLVVEWMDGKKELLEAVAANQSILLEYKNAKKQEFDLIQDTDNQIFKKIKRLKGINFKHQENRFFDTNREQLIPRLLSTEGPKIAVGDVNGDGLEDVYIGGASQQSGALFLQKNNGEFEKSKEAIFQKDALNEDIAVFFFDADSDGNLDLYVGSGGNEFYGENPALKDRLYKNDGKGNFTKSENALPNIFNQTSCVKAADFDSDGDLDLFIGSRSIPVNYGMPPDSYLLINDGKGNFKNETKKTSP